MVVAFKQFENREIATKKEHERRRIGFVHERLKKTKERQKKFERFLTNKRKLGILTTPEEAAAEVSQEAATVFSICSSINILQTVECASDDVLDERFGGIETEDGVGEKLIKFTFFVLFNVFFRGSENEGEIKNGA